MLLFFSALALAHFIRAGWIHYFMGLAPEVHPRTPEQAYRIAVPAAQAWLLAAFHLKDLTVVIATMDFVCALSAFNILYVILVEDIATPATASSHRPIVVISFLAFLAFPCAFVVPWQRPETMPSTLYIAVSLLCLQRCSRSRLWTVALFLGTVVQSFVRADVPFVLGAALVLLGLRKDLLNDFGRRSVNVIRGFTIVAIAGGIEAYLQLVRFRDFPYANHVPVSHNLHAHNLNVFVIAMLPFFFVAYIGFRQRIRLTAIDTTAIGASILYLPLWFTLGKLAEVRIFVPFLFALCIVAAKVAASYLLQDELPGKPAS